MLDETSKNTALEADEHEVGPRPCPDRGMKPSNRHGRSSPLYGVAGDGGDASLARTGSFPGDLSGNARREESSNSLSSSDGRREEIEEQVPIAEMTLFGWGLPSLYCTMILILFPIPYFYLLFYVESDPGALVIDGQELPWRTIFMTKTAFGTGLMLDFVTWLWTVNSSKAKLFIFPAVINFLAYCSYEALSNGYAPILLDFRGRRIMTLRYVQWTFTTPTMLYLYSIVSSISRKELVKAMLMDIVMIISGFLASWLNPSINMVALAVSFACFYFVIHAINNMLTIAIDDCAPEDEKYRNALVWARLFMTLTWAAIPVVWCSAALDLISVTTEENLYQFFDFSSKAGVSCMLLHSSMQTYAQKQADKAMESLQQERQNTIIAMQEASRQKERFFAAISHELRTPLNGIIGLADGIMAGSCGEMNLKVLQRLQTIKVSGQRLCVLVNDILDASSLKTETLRLCEDSLVLSEVCGHVIELTTPLVKKGVELKYSIADGLPPIRADAARIKQILHNVLGNATKFTDSGMVSLSVFLDDKGDNCVFKVSDTGPGIPPDQIDRIWGAFNQGDEGLARRYGGTGLGLTIAKQLVEAHGGTIKCESAVGVGTTFNISIPTRRGGNALKDWQHSRGRDRGDATSPDGVPDREGRPSPLSQTRDAAKAMRDSTPMRRIGMEDVDHVLRSTARRSSTRGSPLRGVSPGGSPRAQREGTSAQWMRNGEGSPYSVSKRRSLTGLLPNLLASGRPGEGGGGERSANSPFDHSVVLPKIRDPTTGRSGSMTGLDIRSGMELASDRSGGGESGLQGAFVHDLDDKWKSLESPDDDASDLEQLRSATGYTADDMGVSTPVSVGSYGGSGLLGRGSYRGVVRTKSADDGQEHKKVLMVGGTRDQCMVLDAMLSPNGYRLITAVGHDNAIDIMQEHDHAIDCVLIDMPDSATLEICKDLRRLFPGHLPIIIISERPDDDSVIKCFDLGASDFMKKPYNKAEVLSRVQTHIKLRDLALKRRKGSDDALGNIHPVQSFSSKRGVYSNELRIFEHQVLMDDLHKREAKLVDLEAKLEQQRAKIESREKAMKLDAKALEEKMQKSKEVAEQHKQRGISSAASVDMVLSDNAALHRLQNYFTSPGVMQAHGHPSTGSPYGSLSVRSHGALEARRDSGGLDVSQLLIAFEAAKADCIMYAAALREAETRARKLRHETSLMGAEAMELVFRGQDLNWLDRQSLASYMLTDLQLWLLHKLGGSTGTMPELSNKTEVRILLQHLGLEHYSIHFDNEEVFSFKDLLRMGETFLEHAGVHTRMSRKRIFSGARILREAADLAMAGSVAAKSPMTPNQSLSSPIHVSSIRTPSSATFSTSTSMVGHHSHSGGGQHRKSSSVIFDSPAAAASNFSPKAPTVRSPDSNLIDSPLSSKRHGVLPAALLPSDLVPRPQSSARKPSIDILRLASYPNSEADVGQPSRAASTEDKGGVGSHAPGANGDHLNGSTLEKTQESELPMAEGQLASQRASETEEALKRTTFEVDITDAGMDITARTPRRSSLQPVIQEPPGSPGSPVHAGDVPLPQPDEPLKWEA